MRSRISELEEQMAADEERIQELLEIMSESDFYMTADDPTAIITEHARLKEELPELENEWLEKTEELNEMAKNC